MPPMSIWIKSCVGISIALFTAGGLIHAADVLRDGWLPYTYAPFWVNVYWTSLLPLDFLAALFLWRRSKWAILLALAIMISDVWINTWMHSYFGNRHISWGYMVQVSFLGFLLAIAWPYWLYASVSSKKS